MNLPQYPGSKLRITQEFSKEFGQALHRVKGHWTAEQWVEDAGTIMIKITLDPVEYILRKDVW